MLDFLTSQNSSEKNILAVVFSVSVLLCVSVAC